MANFTMGQLNPQGLRGGIPRPPMSQAPEDKKEWLRALLMGATLFGGMAGQKKGEKAAPGGFKAPEKPLLAQSFHALAQGIEQKAKGEQLMQQAQKEQRAKQEKEVEEKRRWQLGYGLRAQAQKFTQQLKTQEQLIDADKSIAQITAWEAQGFLKTEQANQLRANMEYFKKHGKYPGKETPITPRGAAKKPEAVTTVDKQIQSIMSGIGIVSDHRAEFVELQGATAETLDAIYNKHVGGLPTQEIGGGTRDKFDALYRAVKERLRKRGENVPIQPTKTEPKTTEKTEGTITDEAKDYVNKFLQGNL